jgi:hypothetical protein
VDKKKHTIPKQIENVSGEEGKWDVKTEEGGRGESGGGDLILSTQHNKIGGGGRGGGGGGEVGDRWEEEEPKLWLE